MAKRTRARGAQLRVGHRIEVWWTGIGNNADIITGLYPYKGPLEYLFPQGAQIATFATGPSMTIDNSNFYRFKLFA